MAESIAILFKSAKWNELTGSISNIALPIGSGNWKYPKNDDEYSLSLYEYDTWLDEYGEDDKAIIKSMLGV